jgi:hypothetical protein
VCAQALSGLSSLRAHLMKSLTGLSPLPLDDSPLPAPYIKCSPAPVPHSQAEHFDWDEPRKRWNYKQRVDPLMSVAAPPVLTIQPAKILKGREGNVSTSPEPPQHKGGGMQQAIAFRSPPHASPASRRPSMPKSGSNNTSSVPSPRSRRLQASSFEETFGVEGFGSHSSSPSAYRLPNGPPEPFHLPAIT